ncbi:ankyrin repeat-containing domain protein, partial [Thelonectria olida]
MTDPLSVAGSAVGVISLGITVAQGLFDYYAAFQGQKSDVAYTTKKLSRLLELLESLRQQLERRQSQADDRGILTSMEYCMGDCKELIRDLEAELNKFNQAPHQGTMAGLRAAGRRIAYPFRQSTLQKLDEDVDDFVSCLSLAMQLLQQSDICRVQDDIEDTKALLDLTRATQVSSGIREWLKAPDATIGFNEAVKKKHPGTGLWFVKGPAFTAWLEKPGSFLWLVGFAGCGKSVLCSTAIQFAFRHRRANPRIGIAFFFFTFNDQSKQDASAMLRALVLQLSSQLDDNRSLVSRLYCNGSPPDLALMYCLHQLVRAFKDVYIVLDALDESPRDKHREAMLQYLAELRAWSEPGLHLIVSSRDEVDIREELGALPEETIMMKNDSVDRDIASFISEHLHNNRRLRKWDEHRARIETALTTRAQGVFRWVECHIKALASCPQSEDLLEQLLDSLPQTLDETYERMLSNIPSTSRDYARQMLTLLCCARRPLTVAELVDGIAVQLGDTPRFNPKRKLKNINAIQEVCPGFTELDVDHNTSKATVRIAHFSVREYLESERIRYSKDAVFFSVRQQYSNAQMACICLTVLLEPGLVTSASTPLQQDNFALTRYAARYWPDHFRDGVEDPPTDVQVLQLFQSKEGLFEHWVTMWNFDDYAGEAPCGKIPAPLYYASLLGLDSIVPRLLDDTTLAALPPTGDRCYGSSLRRASFGIHLLLEKGADVNAEGRRYGSAIQAASAGGHDKTVQLLLEKGADVNAKGGEYGSALQAASARGHDKIIQLLLEKGADVNAEGRRYGSALQAASLGGHNKIVQLLLEKGADVNAGEYGSALQAASFGGHDKIVQLLLEKGADVNAKRGIYRSALQAASARGHDKIVQLLLEKGADVNAEGGEYGSALQAASFEGHDKIVQLLLEKGADVNMEGGRYGSALQAASFGGHDKTVQLLLEKGADVNAGEYGSALQAASFGGHDKTVQLLLEKGADVNAEGRRYGSALQAASFGGHDKIVQLVPEKDADVNAEDGEYRSALQTASFGGHDKIVQLLLEKGADVNAKGGEYGSALQAASARGHDKIIQLLLEKDADINAEGGFYGSALQAASFGGHDKIIQVLLEKDADVNAKGGEYGSALQAASGEGHDKIVQLLLEKGADVNAHGGEYGTALQEASSKGLVDVVKLLLNKGADITIPSNDGWTPLHAASYKGHIEVVKLLL